jgi:glycosyltransferase involved in cell wall biosynthesis
VPALHFVHPGDLATRTGGYRYARSLLAALAQRGVAAQIHRLADAFPFPDSDALVHAEAVLAGIADDSLVVIDGLALGAMPAQVAAHAARLKLVALVHHPLALETGLTRPQAARLAASERAALACVRAVIVTSPATAAGLQDYGVHADRITVILPGTGAAEPQSRTVAPRVQACAEGRPVQLLCVASVTPRKGHLDLVDALAACRQADPSVAWQLTCVGSLTRDPACATALAARIAALGLAAQVSLAGERDEADLDCFYQAADVFVLASYHEGYGMVLAEAIAHGLPIVSTTAGAIPDTVPAAAGLLVAPGDIAALASALSAVISQEARRTAMAAAAARAAVDLPDWGQAARRFLDVLQALQADPSRPTADAAGFPASWLALREPHDHAARDAMLTEKLRGWLVAAGGLARPDPATDAAPPLGIVDLACGTGSTFRYLAPRLGGPQRWILVDQDRCLLAHAPQSGAGTGASIGMGGVFADCQVTTSCLDLAADLDRLPLAGADLITASALLDLVSIEWFKRLLATIVAAGSQPAPAPPILPALLLALTYDGVIRWQPALADDDWTTTLFNHHQRGDKGFGPALGPQAADEVAACLSVAGYSLTTAPSPWHLGPADDRLQREFLAGIAGAAAEMLAEGAAAGDAARLATWLASRTALIAAGISAVEVGHQDLLALPGNGRR